MTDFQKKILTIIQSHFPITPRPYAVLAEQLASDEQTVYDAVGELCASGQIRRIGASINSRKVGYVSTLAALAVPAERVDEVAALINAYPGVTHNYQRENHYNLWFTLIAAELA
ncbi:MAG: hypothetical protein LBL67_01625, partial [Coriobacteriales bacterium]|nr:hypothetical protein [Coriobacteriales bacterium]